MNERIEWMNDELANERRMNEWTRENELQIEPMNEWMNKLKERDREKITEHRREWV